MSKVTPQPKIGFVSLGCPKNLVDSERILTELRTEGYDVVPSYDDANMVIVNTCGFIDSAVQESLEAIGEALNENGKVIVDWVRPGIILYGVSPLEDRSTGADFGCQPVMSLTSSLIAVREHKAGEPVGYGGTWVSERDTRLGVVAMGYGDGYPRAAPSGTPVLVNGREVPIVGRVAMDMICVDLGPQAQDKAGDPVILWGEGLPVERIAEMTKVSAYELITRLTSRVAMKYVD